MPFVYLSMKRIKSNHVFVATLAKRFDDKNISLIMNYMKCRFVDMSFKMGSFIVPLNII